MAALTHNFERSYQQPLMGTKAKDQSISIPHPSGSDAFIFDLSTIKAKHERQIFLRHFTGSRWIDPSKLEFGDVFNMCIDHDVYGVALRYYQFWKMVTVEGRQCPLFLCQMTNGRQGPIDSPGEFFQSDISFILEDRPERNVFVNAVHGVVIIPPSHGKLFIQPHEGRKGSLKECVSLGSKLDHLVEAHPGLLSKLCTYTTAYRKEVGHETGTSSEGAIKEFLQQRGKESCLIPQCTLCQLITNKLQSLSQHKTNRRTRSGKLKPQKDLCEYVTGEGRQYDPTLHYGV